MGSLVVYQSRSGNTETFVNFISKYLVDPYICNDLTADIYQFDKIFIGTYTWKNGRIPPQLKQYLIDNSGGFKGKDVFIFGSGFSVYPKFCGAVDGVSKIVSDCGANVIWTFKFEQRFNPEDFKSWEIEYLIKRIN